MSAKVQKLTMSVKTDESGEVVSVRIVAAKVDQTHPFGDVTAQLTNGEKNALKNLAQRIIKELEK